MKTNKQTHDKIKAFTKLQVTYFQPSVSDHKNSCTVLIEGRNTHKKCPEKGRTKKKLQINVLSNTQYTVSLNVTPREQHCMVQ